MILKNANQRPTFANFFANLTACFGDLAQFEANITQLAALAGIDLREFEIDHLAVRMNDYATADQWKAMLLRGGKLLKESDLNGRPIALITLDTPLTFLNQSVSVIELPYPKGKHYPQAGWEHIEAVVPFLPNECVDAWAARLCKRFGLLENSQLAVKISQPSVNGERLANPTIAIQQKDATQANNCCLKLHPYDINRIICSENDF